MTALIEILVVLLLILLNGLFAMSELALVSARRARLAVLEREGVPGAGIARRLAEDPQHFLPTVQVGITLVSILAGVFGGSHLAASLQPSIAEIAYIGPFAETISLAIVVVLITYLTLVLGELVPKQMALRHSERIAAWVARPIAWTARFSAPAVWLLGISSGLVLRILGLSGSKRQGVTEEELKALLAEGAQAGVLESEERDMIERVLRLADKPVRAIMTPRNELAWVDRTDSKRDIVAALKSAPHSRIVVCEGSVDNVVGVVQAKDLLNRILDGGDLSISASLRQPMVIPDTVSALDALDRLKSDPLGLALVMDEYGSFEGVVSASDVLEAIVGGETAEFDHPDGEGEVGGEMPSEVTLDGMMPVDELKSRLQLPDLPSEGSYHTLGGLLLALLRRVPRVGDRIVFGSWRFEVLEMEGRRVSRAQASREEVATGEDDGG